MHGVGSHNEGPMKIRAGYQISYDCPQPTPMILQLSVHPSRVADLENPDRIRLDPPLPANTYHDSFGNFCHVISAGAGRLTMSTDFVARDDGTPDPIAPQAKSSTRSRTCRSTSCSFCSAAATARPTA